MIQKKTTRLTHVFALMGLLCLCAVLLLSGCGKKQDVETPSVDSDVESALDQIDITAVPAAESASEAEEPGTLLESGTNLNENYYAEVSYFGMASDLTDSTFCIGKEAMAFGKDAQPVLGALTIHYDEDTIVKTAILKADSYEIYAASLDDLQKYVGDNSYSFDIILENPEAEELRAREIRISRWVFN